MKRLVYIIFHVIYQIILCWVLIILNAYYNDLLFPDSFIHSPIRLGVKLLLMVIEGAILILLVFVINQALLSDTEDEFSRKTIAKKTAIIHVVITLCFAIAVIFN